MYTATQTDLVTQFVRIYYEELDHFVTKLPVEEAVKYYQTLLDKGRLFYIIEDGEIVALSESWRVNFEQFGRIICDEPISVYEDIETGYIAYVADIWIREDRRQSNIIKTLFNAFRELNKDCTYFVGQARRKKCEPVKVFKRKGTFKRQGADNE